MEMARRGGGYVVFTTRHHDGFELWDSKVSDFNSVKAAAGRDFVAEYVGAARDAGLKVGLYYSPMDWSWATLNGFLDGKSKRAAGRDAKNAGPPEIHASLGVNSRAPD